MTLAIIVLTNNSFDLVKDMVGSVVGLYDELLVGDAGSTDGTFEFLMQCGATIVRQKDENLGERKQELIEKAKGEWILVLDSDERISERLFNEMKQIINFDKKPHVRKFVKKSGSRRRAFDAYSIPYQNYVFGKPVYYGGEAYNKIRLFRKGKGRVETVPVHEEIIVTGKVGYLHGVLHHHSYRSIPQLFGKFTRYANILAREKKKNREHLSLQKLFLYGPHMMWARFISDQGYKDGLGGFVLAIAFFYMETLTYWLLLFK